MRIFVCSIYRKPHTQIVISFCRHHTSNRKHCQFACGDCVRTCLDHFANLFPQNAFQIDWLDFKWLLLIFFAYSLIPANLIESDGNQGWYHNILLNMNTILIEYEFAPHMIFDDRSSIHDDRPSIQSSMDGFNGKVVMPFTLLREFPAQLNRNVEIYPCGSLNADEYEKNISDIQRFSSL